MLYYINVERKTMMKFANRSQGVSESAAPAVSGVPFRLVHFASELIGGKQDSCV